SLMVASYSIGDAQDYVVLYNNGTATVNLSHYALADSEDSLSGATLPSHSLAPGEKYYVYGAKYTGMMEENSTQVAFSWNDEERIYLYSESAGMTVY
ncbi:MAG: lamin tail domain-containing protein, partial [Lachnospiraceae bacterium]|nr:lamin tail domain-containing protein [Lachnospiraceae bacterium]